MKRYSIKLKTPIIEQFKQFLEQKSLELIEIETLEDYSNFFY